MNGIEILNSTEVEVNYTTNWWLWLASFIWLGIIFVGGLIGFRLEDIDKFKTALVGSFIGALVGLLLLLFVGVLVYHPTAYETHYKVTIDDSVLMTEFLDKYEILDQEGKIYTVKEKTNGQTI
jgi:hypothetical protein